MNRSALLLCLLLGGAACSRKLESQRLGLHYEPPPGMALRLEEVGPPAVAHFEGGLELREVEEPALRLDAAPEAVREAAGLSSSARQLQATQGTLPAGPVARYEFQQGASRTLVYLLPRERRAVLVVYTAAERDYGPGSARVERSLSTLAFTR